MAEGSARGRFGAAAGSGRYRHVSVEVGEPRFEGQTKTVLGGHGPGTGRCGPEAGISRHHPKPSGLSAADTESISGR